VNFLANPLVPRMLLALFGSALLCLTAFIAVRVLRRNLTKNDPLRESHPDQEQFPLHTFQAVIQDLKLQKHELLTAQQAEKRRAKTAENISAAVLSHLASGVMFFGQNGLVRQANGAAKNILGFASPVGMSAAEIFRSAAVVSEPQGMLAQILQSSLQQRVPEQTLKVEYLTPAAQRRELEITLTSVRSATDEVLGAACLINDRTEAELSRKEQELRGEMSAEMALALRSSLNTISGYAQQLSTGRDPERTRQLASDIISEAAHLNETLGGFLVGTNAMTNSAGA